MATYLLSEYLGRTISGFDVDTDILSFLSDTDGSAADVTFNVSGANLILSTPQGVVTLEDVSIREITTSNLHFSDNSQVYIGDNTTDNFADDNAQNGTADTILAGNSNNNVWLFGGADTATIAGDGSNFVHGNAGNDTVVMDGTGNNTVRGGAGNDSLDMNATADGNNFLRGDSGADTIDVGGAGDNTIYGGNGLLGAADGADDINIEATATGNNLVNGNAGDDDIAVAVGANGNHTLRGGLGDDSITTNSNGNQLIKGDDGDDTITVNGDGNNLVYGDNDFGDTGDDVIVIDGTGNNTVWGGIADGAADADTITITVNATGDNAVNGNTGEDVINVFGAGDNTLRGGFGDDEITVNDGGGAIGLNLARGDGGADTLAVDFSDNAANLITLEGGVGADEFDVTLANATHRVVIADFDGTIDNVILDLSGVSAAEITLLSSAGSQQIAAEGADNERVVFSGFTGNFTTTNTAFADGSVLHTNFNNAAATLTGTVGDDQLIAGSNGDTLVGGGGADVLTGGAGVDVFQFTAATANAGGNTFDNLATLVGGSGTDVLKITGATAVTLTNASFAHMQSVETIQLTGSAAHNITLGANGNAAGIRTVDASASDVAVTINTSAVAAATVVGGTDAALLAGDQLTIGTGANYVNANIGDDYLSVGGGAMTASTLLGGDGVDQLFNVTGTATFDGVRVSGWEGIYITGAGGDDVITVTAGYESTLDAAANALLPFGSDMIFILSGAGAVVIDWSAVVDADVYVVATDNSGGHTLMGGGGDDFISYTGADAEDISTTLASLSGGGGTDTLELSDSAGVINAADFARISGIEHVFLNDDVDGFSITTNADVTEVDASGVTTITYTTTIDTSARASVTVIGSGGIDNVTIGNGSSNDVDLGDAADTLAITTGGTTTGNTLIGGDGYDIITGVAGTVTFDGTVLNGWENITITASGDNDVITFSAAYEATLSADAAAVLNGASLYVLASGSGNVVIDFSDFTTVIAQAAGDEGDDTLIGGGGDERFAGRDGVDSLTGGAGGDLFIFLDETHEGDIITDFGTGGDVLLFSQTAAFGSLNFNANYVEGNTAAVQAAAADDTVFVITDAAGFANYAAAEAVIEAGHAGTSDFVLIFWDQSLNGGSGAIAMYYDTDSTAASNDHNLLAQFEGHAATDIAATFGGNIFGF